MHLRAPHPKATPGLPDHPRAPEARNPASGPPNRPRGTEARNPASGPPNRSGGPESRDPAPTGLRSSALRFGDPGERGRPSYRNGPGGLPFRRRRACRP